MADQVELTRPQTGKTIETIIPATGEKGKIYPEASLDEARQAAAAAHEAFLNWRRTSFADRSAIIHKAAEALRARKDELARLMTEEMGKTVTDGRAEVEKCAFHCDWFADHAAGYLADEPVDFDGEEAFVTFNPIGVVLAVMPWNFPFWQVFRFAAPALMAGNGALLKHASNVPGCALAIEEVLHQAGVPHDLFRTLLLPSREVEALIKDDNVTAVTLTGSVAAGRSVATAAGSVLKKSVLELGGSDAYVILEDADVQAAAKVAATARMVNGGQSCIAGKRFIVVREILRAFRRGSRSRDVRVRYGRSAKRAHEARPDAEREGSRRDPPSGRPKRRQGRETIAWRHGPRSAGRLVSGNGAQQRAGGTACAG